MIGFGPLSLKGLPCLTPIKSEMLLRERSTSRDINVDFQWYPLYIYLLKPIQGYFATNVFVRRPP